MSVMGENRRNGIRGANDRFLIRKRTLCATASNDGTWPKADVREYPETILTQVLAGQTRWRRKHRSIVDTPPATDDGFEVEGSGNLT